MALNYSTRLVPSGLSDGGFFYEIEWLLNPIANGIIVQEIHWRFDVQYYMTGAKWTDERIKSHLGMPNPFEDWFNYWERWTVSRQPARIDPLTTDRIALTVPNPLFPYTVGNIVIQTSASFYPGIQTPFEFQNRGGLAGGLASVLNHCPPLPMPVGNPILRTISVSWDCSDGQSHISNIVVNPNPVLMNLA